MRSRVLALLVGAAVCLGTALVAVPLTHADAASSTFVYKPYTMCADDPDGKLCVEYVKRNDVPTTVDYPDGPGPTEWLYVDNGYRNGMFGFNINTITRPSPGADPVASKNVDLNATWEFKVDTGSYVPRELNLKGRNVEFTKGGDSISGYWFIVKLNPTPIAWRFFDDTFTCDMTSCGTDTTVADFSSDEGMGYSDGYVTDLADSDLSTRYVYARTGYYMASNAQYQGEPYYDAETNSIVVELANPHLKAVGVQAKGYFETFLPNSYLVSQLGVPDPASLTGGSFTVTRLGTTTTTPFALTNTGDGVRIKVDDIGFSRPKYRVKPKPRVPGKPRLTGVLKVPGAAKSYFKAPLADGGPNINLYQAACRKSTAVPFTFKTGTSSPITVTSLPPGTVYCQVRARNSVGWGPWGKAAASHT